MKGKSPVFILPLSPDLPQCPDLLPGDKVGRWVGDVLNRHEKTRARHPGFSQLREILNAYYNMLEQMQ